jgi:hypothetical protein
MASGLLRAGSGQGSQEAVLWVTKGQGGQHPDTAGMTAGLIRVLLPRREQTARGDSAVLLYCPQQLSYQV